MEKPEEPITETAELQDEAKRIAGLIADGKLDSAKEELESTIQRRQAPVLTSPRPEKSKRSLKERIPPLLERIPIPPWALLAGTVAAALVVVLLLVSLLSGRTTEPEPQPLPVEPVAVVQEPGQESAGSGTLLLLADPWGQVVTITNSSGSVVSPGPEPDTPWIQTVPPGRYSITLARPQTGEIRTCIVDVPPGGQTRCQVKFEALDPSSYFQETGWWR